MSYVVTVCINRTFTKFLNNFDSNKFCSKNKTPHHLVKNSAFNEVLSAVRGFAKNKFGIFYLLGLYNPYNNL